MDDIELIACLRLLLKGIDYLSSDGLNITVLNGLKTSSFRWVIESAIDSIEEKIKKG